MGWCTGQKNKIWVWLGVWPGGDVYGMPWCIGQKTGRLEGVARKGGAWGKGQRDMYVEVGRPG